MKNSRLASVASAVFLLATAPAAALAQGGSVGSVTISGPVLVDGQTPSGTPQLGAATRISTGDGGSAVIALAGGGELRLEGQADVVVAQSGNGVRVQLICGKAQLTSTAPATFFSTNGGHAEAVSGSAEVTTGGKTETIKAGKKHGAKNGDSVISVVPDASSTVSLESSIHCDCNCK